VQNDLGLANDNFDILGQAFIGNDPSSQPVKRAVYIGSTPPSGAVANTLWLDTSVSPPRLKIYNGTSWVNFDADTVDGFHASHTPQANTIPVAGSTGKLDAGWLPAVGNFNQVEFTSSGTWNVPSGVTKILVIACAGGGGGGGGSATVGGGEGGYSGSSTVRLYSVSSDETLTITIGAGGSGGGRGNAGGNGGNTSISGSVSGTLLSLSGGIGGRANWSIYYDGSTCYGRGTGGQSSMFGRGGKGGSDNQNGENAPNYGAGGGGGGSNYSGGAGSAGIVRIIYFA
jgi:hypothetical protein